MSVGKHTYGNDNVEILFGSKTDVTFGAFCSIAAGVKIHIDSSHRVDWLTTYPFGHIHKNIFNTFDGAGHPTGKGPVTIGNDVWIGRDAVILSGITIGDGAVVGCNTVVTKDIKPYHIVCGNPGVAVKKRFTDDNIEKMLEISWWKWDDQKINEYIPLLCARDIDAFIAKATDSGVLIS